MTKAQKPKRGRPFLGDKPLNHKVCGHFDDDAFDRLSTWADSEEVTLAELIRRCAMDGLKRSGF